MLGESIVNLAVTRNRLHVASGGILIDVVPPSMPQEDAPRLLQLANQLASLQTTISFIS